MACSTTSNVDLDEDGYSEIDDCNDNDATIHPGAEEVCDGADNDCDGESDNDATDGTTYYPDSDGDGFGSDAAVISCEPLDNHVEKSGDCNDNNNKVNPDATEVCDNNETDDDCDGLINLFDDSIDMSTVKSYYPDDDKDGYGDDASDATLACKDPSTSDQRYVTNNNDCDDTTKLAKPGGTEVCDGLDNDCDDTTREDGMVLSVDRSGGREDRTTTFAAGSASLPVTYNPIGEETLYFCKGDYFTRITTNYGIDLVGVNGATQTTLSGASHGTVLTIKGDSLDASINGLTIEGGQASDTDAGLVEKAGGGIYCDGISSLDIVDSEISNNTSKGTGGAIHNEDCNIVIENSTLSDNEVDQAGGAISNFGGSITLKTSDISDNDAEYLGGGVYMSQYSDAASSDITRPATLTLEDSTIQDNDGGFFGGGLYLEIGATVTCNGGAGDFGVYGNTASFGGGIYIFEGRFTSVGCDFGEDGSTIPANDPNTVYVSDGAAEYDFGNDANFECTHVECES